MVTIADESNKANPIKHIHWGNWTKIEKDGFLYLNGKLREVIDIHRTYKGIQFELDKNIIASGVTNRYVSIWI